MIYLSDNAIPIDKFVEIKEYLINTAIFRTVESESGKKFHVTEAPFGLEEALTKTIEKTHGRKIKMVNCFVRLATKYLDKEWNIHCDLLVAKKERPDYGAVFYFNEGPDLNGTALWKHEEMGHEMPEDADDQEVIEFDKNNGNNVDKWQLSTILGARENRIVGYEASLFHSKFPREAYGVSQKDGRLVCVLFYRVLK